MNFWNNLFKRKEEKAYENYFLKQKAEHIDAYANSWVNTDIPELTKSISELIYQKELTENIINTHLNLKTDSDYGGSGWPVKGILNFPGPFYTGTTDSCGTGIIESPNNVIFDENYMEHVMIQPRNEVELLNLWNAGAVEVFGSYYCDGNKHWTVTLVKNWWVNKYEIVEHLKNNALIKLNCNQEKRYIHYLENFAELDLRKYCFFLENGFYPTNEKLPELL